MKRLIYILALCVLALAGVSSCINDDYATGSGDVLAFSVDTLVFDTVITAQSTPTKQFMIFNHSNKIVNISSIKVAGLNDEAKFYLNVDGTKGSEFHDIEIRGGDSAFVFVESHIDATNQDAPVDYLDRIDFVTNGVTQHVYITASGQDVIRISGDTITEDTHFEGRRPYLIYDTITVAEGATLTLDAGATLLFHDKAALRVRGRLIANGTQDGVVTLRGDRLDHVVGQINYDIMSGQWGGVDIDSTSTGNRLQYVSMRGSTTGLTVESASPEVESLYLLNCVLHNSAGSVLTTLNAYVTAVGSEFSEAAGSVVSFTGGRVEFAQCTMANYYLFAVPSGAIVNFELQDEDRYYTTLTGHLDNCIIYGNASDVSMGDLTGTDIYLRNCLLRSNGTDDANFISCKWGGDPLFYTVRSDYVFDYRLKNKSDAIAIGNRSYMPSEARYDMYGVDRLSRDGIDIGAYTWVPAEDEE